MKNEEWKEKYVVEKATNDIIKANKNSDNNFKERSNKFVIDKIASGEYGTTINAEKQASHMESTVKAGKSYLFDNVDPQALFNEYAGTGVMELDIKGYYTNKEICKAKYDVGINSRSNKKTKMFKIHHSKKRTHIVPKRED